MKCKKCQSENLVMRPNAKNPSATELVCGDCGTWQKFIGKEEIRLFEMKNQNKPITAIKQSRAGNEAQIHIAASTAKSLRWVANNLDGAQPNTFEFATCIYVRAAADLIDGMAQELYGGNAK